MKAVIVVLMCVMLTSCTKKKDCYVCYILNTYTNVKGPDETHCGWDNTDMQTYVNTTKANNTFKVGGNTYYRMPICRLQ